MADCVGPNASLSLAKGNKKEEPKRIKFGRENGEGNDNYSPFIWRIRRSGEWSPIQDATLFKVKKHKNLCLCNVTPPLFGAAHGRKCFTCLEEKHISIAQAVAANKSTFYTLQEIIKENLVSGAVGAIFGRNKGPTKWAEFSRVGQLTSHEERNKVRP
jgi:hypothetical protein